MRLNQKVALITGGANGIGLATTERFAKEGAKIILWDVSDKGNDIVERLKKEGHEAIFKKVSVTNQDEVNDAVTAAQKLYGRIDILINNAGITKDRTLLKMSKEEWDDVISVNLTGVFNCTRAVAPIMKDQNYGRIVSASSNVAIRGNFGQTNYGAAKLSLVGFMNSLKLEGARDNIKVNAICPVAATRMTEALMPPAILEMLKPEYISPAVAYLASDDAPTGVIFTAAAGVYAAAQLVETDGVNLGHSATADDIAAHFGEICDWTTAKHYGQGGEQNAKFLARVQEKPVLG